MPLPIENQRYTYADYCTWDDGKRWELINGVPYEMFPDETRAMSPAPAWRHQRFSSNLHRQFANFLYGKPCKVFAAPFDVRLNADEYDDTVVQPDLVIICDSSKISGTGCNGAPDMVIEILSPASIERDILIKFRLYKEAGVREYWIVDPERKTVLVYVLENGRYVVSDYSETDTAPVHVLDGCEIRLTDVFAE